MSEEVFRAAVDRGVYEDHMISIGGGEPTVHPKFWQFLDYAMAKTDGIWLATNGKRTRDALRLALLAKIGDVSVDLSLDRWHEPIDKRVVKAFTEDPCDSAYDSRGVRNVGRHFSPGPIRSGRWKEGNRIECPCPETFVRPSGEVRQCGCKSAPVIGHVLTGYDRSGDHCHNDDAEVA
jgi:MoaA/NifB/PqqE/SkfB family radical SAM enzyme